MNTTTDPRPTATLVRELPRYNEAVIRQALYHVDPPLEYGDGLVTSYIAVSASDPLRLIPGRGLGTLSWVQTETYIFPADSKGKFLDRTELPGSYRGGLDHETALDSAGYQIQYPA